MSERVLEWGSSEWGSEREVHPAAAAACGGEDLRPGHHPLGPVDVAEAALRRHQAARELRGLPARRGWGIVFLGRPGWHPRLLFLRIAGAAETAMEQ